MRGWEEKTILGSSINEKLCLYAGLGVSENVEFNTAEDMRPKMAETASLQSSKMGMG
jgi:hypothetical protein